MACRISHRFLGGNSARPNGRICSRYPSSIIYERMLHLNPFMLNKKESNDNGGNRQDCVESDDYCDLPEVPTNCCMSGCANCVWVKYAEQLINKFEGGGDIARDMIMKNVQDPNMRAFLELELRMMSK